MDVKSAFLNGIVHEKLHVEQAKRFIDVDRPDHVTKDEDGKSIDIRSSRSLSGSLVYLTASRPDISHSIGVCARYQADPKKNHLNLLKRKLKYIQVTFNHGLLYTFDTNSSLVGYCDAD
ncbi:hypothetical protein LIER_31567 [Lithospermum erythrorhizon]|uniref:Uncharacterized protein n=1 Tax=Lithospermum erythrorhizon TaxID=34254 RepID=A0AAV3RUZ9_LITER